MIRAAKNSRWLMLSAAIAFGFALLAGGRVRAQDGAAKADAPKKISEGIEKRLSAVERQIGELDESSKALRKQLDQMDAAREALKINATNLRAELSGAEPVKVGKPEKSEMKDGKAVEKDETSVKRVGFVRFIFQFIFVSLIVGCVFVIVRIFINRWHEQEPEAEPMVEKETELGTVRHPAKMESVPDKVEPQGTESVAVAGAGDEEKSIEFKPTPEGATSDAEKTSNKDYY